MSKAMKNQSPRSRLKFSDARWSSNHAVLRPFWVILPIRGKGGGGTLLSPPPLLLHSSPTCLPPPARLGVLSCRASPSCSSHYLSLPAPPTGRSGRASIAPPCR